MITAADVLAARERVPGYVHRTPVARSTTLGSLLGTNVYLKLELFQKTGSFKPRGAFNQMLTVDPKRLHAGVVGVSGGNFAQGLAFAGASLAVDTLVVMPETTPEHYVAATRGYGAQVELADGMAAAFARVDEVAEQGRAMMHPYDNPQMMAGDGTLGLEIVEDVPDITDLFISVGGGGLITGVITAVKAMKPDVRMWAVETEGADCLTRSLAAGRQVHMTPTGLAKTLGAPYPAEAAMAIAETFVEELTVVSDEEAYRALRLIMERCKVVPELAASCTLAAALRHADHLAPSDHVVLLLCGGNVSANDLADYMERFD